MIVLDTTVLVYAVGVAHALQEPCRRLLRAIADQQLVASTTPEVIQEFVHVRSRRRSRADAVRLGHEWVHLLTPLPTVTERHLAAGLQLCEQLPSLGCFDAVLAATAQELDAEAFVSADRRFADVPYLPHVMPDDNGVNSLLEAQLS